MSDAHSFSAAAVLGAEPINTYAVVFYASGPLAEFLDALRIELEPDHPSPRSHVTVLPPRSLLGSAEDAIRMLEKQSARFAPFQAMLGGVDTFPGTNVVFLSVAHGYDDLNRMHRRLNMEALRYDEPFPYHPHITMAQGLTPAEMPEVLETVRRRWEEYKGPRGFACKSWYFVQATADQRWIDLAEIKLP